MHANLVQKYLRFTVHLNSFINQYHDVFKMHLKYFVITHHESMDIVTSSTMEGNHETMDILISITMKGDTMLTYCLHFRFHYINNFLTQALRIKCFFFRCSGHLIGLESSQSGHLSSKDQCMDIMSTFISIDSFQVHTMTNNVILI